MQQRNSSTPQPSSSPGQTGFTRRTALIAVSAAVSGLLAACTVPRGGNVPTPLGSPSASGPTPSASPVPTITPTPMPPPPVVPSVTRVPVPEGVITGLPGEGNLLAWTVDDGTDSSVVAAYAAFAAETGTRLTLFATAGYPSWKENAEALRPLVESGQVQMGNHTWGHPDLTSLPYQGVVDELQRTHDLIGELFGVDARPFFRPPYGYYNEHVLEAAASIGYTSPTLWYGSLADSGLISEQRVLHHARGWFLPQHIVIGHLNFEPVTRVFPELLTIIRKRALTTVTLNDVFSSTYHP